MEGPEDMIEVQGGLSPPRLPGRVVARDSFDNAMDAQLADLYIHALNCVRAFGSFQLAISASSEIEQSLMRLMYDLNFREFPWARTRIWMLDELVGDVVTDDSRLRGMRLSETILACSGIPENQFHILTASKNITDAKIALAEYEATIREQLEWREKGHDRFDCCLVASDSAGRIDAFAEDKNVTLQSTTSQAGNFAQIDRNFIRGSRLLSVLIAPGAGEGIVTFARANMRQVVPVGGEVVWYFSRSGAD